MSPLSIPLLPRYVQGTPYPCRIRIRYGYTGDTRRMRTRGVSASPRAYRTRNCLSGTFRRVRYGPYHPTPVDSPSPRCPTEYNAPPLCLSARTRATQQGEVGRPPATSPPATSHRRRDAAPREAPPPARRRLAAGPAGGGQARSEKEVGARHRSAKSELR